MATVSLSNKSTIVRNSFRLFLLRSGFRLGAWLLPALTLQRAFRLFGTPLPGARQKALRIDTQGAQQHALSLGADRIMLYQWGDVVRQPVVLLAHGWSSHGLFFLPWVQALQQAGYAVVSFDQIAHGRSSGQFATLPRFAEAIDAVADHLGPLSAIIGHSLGGAATMLALSKGLKAERIILIAPAADPKAAARRFGRWVGLTGHLSRHLFDDFESLTGISVDSLQAHVNVPHLAQPALVIHDIEDREVPWSEGERYARYWPQSRLLSTTGLGHNRIANDSQVIRSALGFLRGEMVGQRVVSTADLPFGFA